MCFRGTSLKTKGTQSCGYNANRRADRVVWRPVWATRLAGAFQNSQCGRTGQREGGILLLLVLGRSGGMGREKRAFGVCSSTHSFPGSSDPPTSCRRTALWVTRVCNQCLSDGSVLTVAVFALPDGNYRQDCPVNKILLSTPYFLRTLESPGSTCPQEIDKLGGVRGRHIAA